MFRKPARDWAVAVIVVEAGHAVLQLRLAALL